MKESGKENDGHSVDSVKGSCVKNGARDDCDVGYVRDRTFEVVYKTEDIACISMCCKQLYLAVIHFFVIIKFIRALRQKIDEICK